MKNRGKGFTLIELLVVMVILALLAGLVGPRFLRFIKPAQASTAKVQVANFEQAIQHFYLENSASYPPSLDALVPNYMEEIPLDPWGNPYVYQFPGSHGKDYDIESYGPDRSPGGDDDITNYKK
ncbi:MAG: type II secretion system major pseudopilin GspG [Candidatus Aureabacteria bacterium]|nr:type II secretion system major pseudopilin GspG [Candidatus Auribacterota bacterium]